MAELLRLEGVNLENAEGRSVFRNLDWSLPLGGRARVQAASGAGASALLRLCAGLAEPQQGSVFLDGVALTPHAFAHPFLKKGGIGWVPRNGGLQANLSLCANVALPLRFLRGHSRLRAEELAIEWLEATGLAGRAQDRPHALEPKERWMGALVRAAATEVDLWLVDQPPASLDPQERHHVSCLLRQAAENPNTAFLIIGDADGGEVAAIEFCIENGRIVPGGTS